MDPQSLNKIIHERVRLAVMSALVARDRMTFNEIKTLLKVTDGNLSVHTAILEKHGLVEIQKTFRGKKPQTTFVITRKGQEAFENYVTQLELMLKGPG